jgi:polysaccharide pyruvyl transferase WcaK-like protein
MAILYPTRIKKSNLGDILINVLLIRELSKNDVVYLDSKPDRVIESLITINNPYKDNIKFDKTVSIVDGRPVVRWLKLLKTIPSLSVVFDPPGHYFGGGKVKTMLKTMKYISRARLLKSRGIKMVRFGITLGPFTPSEWKTQKQLAKTYTGIGIRDKSNYNKLVEKGLENLFLIDDVSLLYTAKDFISKDNKLKEKYGEYAVISFRGAIEGSVTDTTYLNNIIELFKKVVAANVVGTNTTLVFAYQVKEDLPVIEEMLNSIKDFDVKTVLIEEQLNFTDAINLYNGAKYVLSNRLHVALLALLNDAPAYVITDVKEHHKLVNVFNDLSLSELLIDSKEYKSVLLKSKEEMEIITQNFESVKNKKRGELQKSISQIVAKN